jgi:hypothetical protein
MHNPNNKSNVACFASDKFINSLSELKNEFDFNLIFIKNPEKELHNYDFNVLLIDSDILEGEYIVKFINDLKSVSKLLISNSEKTINISFDKKIKRPISIIDLNKRLLKLLTSKEFSKNSSIKIKEYKLNKNEKKLFMGKKFIVVTEKEIQLLELLISQKEPISKKDMLNKVWNYSSEADTHTVETHIYRLRKKIVDKFGDDNVILNKKNGYLI